MLSSAAGMQEMKHDDDDGDDEQNVDESARDAKCESAHPEEQQDHGNNEEHVHQSRLPMRSALRPAPCGLGRRSVAAVCSGGLCL
jgi:ABC-type Zn2+ transport system substrate-binding protein/surface adhesin